MGGRDQSQMKNKNLKSSKKVSPFQIDIPKSHNDDKKEGPKVTEEIRRSGGDPTRSEIQEYHLVESQLSIVVGDTRVRM